jgi:hypothetical protein
MYRYASTELQMDAEVINTLLQTSELFLLKNFNKFNNYNSQNAGSMVMSELIHNEVKGDWEAYCFSNTEDINCNQSGESMVIPAIFSFLHWEPTNLFLHKVSFYEKNISRDFEKGHHDGASNVSYDHYYYVTKVKSIHSWKLDNEQSLLDLLTSGFIKQMRYGLMTYETEFNQAIIKIASDDLSLKFIKQLQLNPKEILKSINNESGELLRLLLKEKLISIKDIVTKIENK